MVNIFIAGDSTAANKELHVRPETGWGEKIPLFFKETTTIQNKAKNGRSSKSFIEEGLLAVIEQEIQAGDYLFIQFGHNDQKIKESKGTQPYGDYLDYLAQFIDVAKRKQATPILLTSITRRDYLPNGQLNFDTLGQYPEAMKSFAKRQNIVCLDLFQSTQDWLTSLEKDHTAEFFLHAEPNKWKNYPDGIIDNTHLNDLGAYYIASLVADAIKKSPLDLKKELIK